MTQPVLSRNAEAEGDGPDGGALRAAIARIRAELEPRARAATREGMPALELDGQLIRPLVACAGASGLGVRARGERFWEGVLAIQMVHEASLVHDDVVDGAAVRRGEPTVVAARGVAAALIRGDHLLTAAYRVAARTGSLRFVELLARAVERTVAGEREQGALLGRALDEQRYRAIASGKAGELLGCALAAGAAVAERPEVERRFELGRRVGVLYQMLDDLLDFCPTTDAGKPTLGDYAQGRWTWPLAELADGSLGRDPAEVARLLRAADGRGTPLRRCLARLEHEVDEVAQALRAELGPEPLLAALLADWRRRAHEAVAREECQGDGAPTAPLAPPRAALRARVPDPERVTAFLERHSRSFRFATRFFPRHEAERVARVYAYCRVTDDLVDRPESGEAENRETLLREWMLRSHRAYLGTPSGLPFLDRVMGEMAEADVPFAYAEELAEGMRMDLRGESYASLQELRVYTYRVASVVGLWITRLCGVHEPHVLQRAAALGHAMQLTNILRDVGEDLRSGRVYLPRDLMRRHGVSVDTLQRMGAGTLPILPGYRSLLEELMRCAEAEYGAAFPAIPCLPPAFRRPVAVAALVYRGIHQEIRRLGYDNLRRRAATSPGTKVALAARALWALRAAARDTTLARAAGPG